ncbi:competence/damage-inducible protein A [bacterium]|nr:competence/damage-inducible protein A [bacterium]
MDVTILTIGAEILKGRTLNSNAQYISLALNAGGFAVREVRTVDDNDPAILGALEEAFRSVPVIVATGGLGPTRDDVTKSAACRFFNRGLVQDESVMQHLKALFARMGYGCIPKSSLGQALVPEGATVLPNRRGTAPGLLLEEAGWMLFLLPGVPVEMEVLIDEQVVPLLKRRFGGEVRPSAVVRTVGIGESVLAERIEAGLAEADREYLSYYPKGGLVDVVISPPPSLAVADSGTVERIADHVAAVAAEGVYSRDERDLFQVDGDLLAGRGQRLALAESCTGGWLAKTFTDAPGSSRYLESAVVSYSNAAKSTFLGVEEALIQAHGAVSEPVARAMAEGVRQRAGADYALSLTGIAGPGGGSPEKPVGTVFIALAGPGGTAVRHFSFGGDREQVRWRAVVKAAELLWRTLTEAEK